MRPIEVVAVLRFLQKTRQPAQSALGMEVPDPFWNMTFALLSRHYSGGEITVSAVAVASGVPHATALRYITVLENNGLIARYCKPGNQKLVFVRPTPVLIGNFTSYCIELKSRLGEMLGTSDGSEADFTVGISHLSAKIIPAPGKIQQSLNLGHRRLRCLFKDDPTFLSLARLKSEVESLMECYLDIQLLGYDQLRQCILENAASELSGFDIVAVDMPWIAQLSEMGALIPLDQEIRRTRLNVFDFYAAAWEASQYRGKQMGIPFAPTVELFLYRADLFEAAGLAPPQTVTDVVRLAECLHSPSSGLFGISWNAAAGQPLGQTFLQVMGAFGRPLIDMQTRGDSFVLAQDNMPVRPTIQTEAGSATIAYLQELTRYSPPEIAEMDWQARVQAFQTGRTAMSYEWSYHAATFEWDPLSPARERTGYLPHPRGPKGHNVSPMGGWALAIPANVEETRREGIWQVMSWLSAPEMVKHLILNASPVNLRYSVCSDPEVQAANPVLKTVDVLSRLGQVQSWQRPPIPQITDMMQVIGEEVHKTLFGDVDAATAMKRADERLMALA